MGGMIQTRSDIKNVNNGQEFIINGEWVLINAFFYKFWIKYSEFQKYNIKD